MGIRNMQGVGAHLEKIPYEYQPQPHRIKRCMYNKKGICKYTQSNYCGQQCIGKMNCVTYKYMAK